MSFFTMAFLGMASIGSIFTGYIAEMLGIRFALLVNACVCLIHRDLHKHFII